MKKTILFFLILILASCGKPKTENTTTQSDINFKKSTDSVMRVMKLEELKKDSINIANRPVVILNSRIVSSENSRFKDIEVKYKNNSKHKISAIRFQWMGLNAFGDPADMGGRFRGVGGGFVDDPLLPGKSRTSTWGLLSTDAKKVIKVIAVEIVFYDGSKLKYKMM